MVWERNLCGLDERRIKFHVWIVVMTRGLSAARRGGQPGLPPIDRDDLTLVSSMTSGRDGNRAGPATKEGT